MFYSHLMLAKKGPLGVIWTAAHLERRLRKNQIVETDISVSIDTILESEVPIALRLSGHLLLGVVRVFSRKVNYLLQDCQETQIKVKQALRPSLVDLPPEVAMAPFQAVTLPEAMDFNEEELDYFPYHIPTTFRNVQIKFFHTTTRDQITLPEGISEEYPMGERFDVTMEDRRGISMAVGEELISAEAMDQASYERIQKISEEFIPAMDLELEEKFQAELRAEETRRKEEVVQREIERLRAVSVGEMPQMEPVSFEPGVLTPRGVVPGVTPTITPRVSVSEEEAKAVSEGLPVFPSPEIEMYGPPVTPTVEIPEIPEFVVQPSPKRRKMVLKKRTVLDETTYFPSEVMRKQLTDTTDIVRTRQPISISILPPPLVEQVEVDEMFNTLSVTELPSALSIFVHDFLRMEYAPPSPEEVERERKRKEEEEKKEREEVEKEMEETRMREEEMERMREELPEMAVQGFEFPPTEEGAERMREEAERERERERVRERESKRVREGIIEEEEREEEMTVEVEAMRKDEFVQVQSPEFVMQPTEFPIEESIEEIKKKEEEEARELMAAELVTDLDFLKDARGQDIIVEKEKLETEPGWSTRTRKAAKYFQTEFVGQRERNIESPAIQLLQTLQGKNKKQAARLFFESLVLKSRDYIQVHQPIPYSEITITPKPKLMETSL